MEDLLDVAFHSLAALPRIESAPYSYPLVSLADARLAPSVHHNTYHPPTHDDSETPNRALLKRRFDALSARGGLTAPVTIRRLSIAALAGLCSSLGLL